MLFTSALIFISSVLYSIVALLILLFLLPLHTGIDYLFEISLISCDRPAMLQISLLQMLWWFYRYFLKDFLNLFFGEGKGERKRGEKHQCVVASHAPRTGDLACNPGICPDWESNWRPFDSQAGTQPLSHISQGFSIDF